VKEEPLFSNPLDELLGGTPSLPALEPKPVQSSAREHRIGFASASLHLSAVLLISTELYLVFYGTIDAKFGPPAWYLGPYLLGPVIFAEMIAIGIRGRSIGARSFAVAWFGLCLMLLPFAVMVDVGWFWFCVTSPLFLLGVLGLWGLLAPGSREAFGIIWRDGRWHYPD